MYVCENELKIRFMSLITLSQRPKIQNLITKSVSVTPLFDKIYFHFEL